MKTAIFNELSSARGSWLDYSQVERLNLIRATVDDPFAEPSERAKRLRAAQPEILEIIAPTLDEMHGNALETIEGAIALNKVMGYEIDATEHETAEAASEINKALRDIRTGRRIVDFDDLISGDFLISE